MICKKASSKWIVLVCLIFILLAAVCASVVYGYTGTSWRQVYQAFTSFNGTNEHVIIKDVRLPRALVATVVGASLAAAGALMQALTKNPLASPGIFGINAGAGFFIVAGSFFLHIQSPQALVWSSFLGAAFTAAIVYAAGSLGRKGLTPIKLTLAGAAMAAMFSSLTQGLLSVNELELAQVLFWLTGSVQGRSLDLLMTMFPYAAAALVICFFLGQKINLLVMGEDVAKGLGQKTGLLKFVMALCVVMLAGSAVAIAGPISFIGIIIPHFARFVVGNDYRWVLPFSAVLGAILLVCADIGARYIIMPQEVPVGVMTAIIGMPVFVYIARRGAKL
ncbi:FecCD family ABC transporter permease [Bacillus subtilis]|uniref:FecCD family ABC transporter permease n=1 Tax=Bacillus subtilis TaxID=1423 RepID=UPI001065ADDA|nr:iron ABC transporter permease [Bacillus subtilis]TDY54491.1 iron complex transport system permease protein [Bacillus subtilis]